jgi:hypothetical protein
MRNKSIATALKRIIITIADAINIDYFKDFIGQTHSIYLLIYIAGLIICQKNVAMTRIEQFIRLGKHDSFYKMLNGISLTSIMLTKFFVGWIEKHRKCSGWLCLDDTVIEKEYSKHISYAGYAWSSKLERSVMGIHVVALYWTDGTLRIPVGLRLWVPREKTTNYCTKVDLALDLITSTDEFCKTCEYIAFDSWYCTNKILRICSILGIHFASQLKKNRIVVFNGRKTSVSSLSCRFCQVELPGYGSVLVYRDGAHRAPRWLINSNAMCSAREVKKRYDSRWEIEEVFRFMKQNLGLEGCQCRRKTAVQNHVSIVLLAHFVIEIFSARQSLKPYGCSMIILLDYFNLNKKLPNLHQRKVFMKSVA